jgi:hypothetical protein
MCESRVVIRDIRVDDWQPDFDWCHALLAGHAARGALAILLVTGLSTHCPGTNIASPTLAQGVARRMPSAKSRNDGSLCGTQGPGTAIFTSPGKIFTAAAIAKIPFVARLVRLVVSEILAGLRGPQSPVRTRRRAGRQGVASTNAPSSAPLTCARKAPNNSRPMPT